MITIYSNGVQQSIDYTVENNLIPTTEEVRKLIKRIFYSTYANSGITGYSGGYVFIEPMISNFRLAPGMLDTGSIKVYDNNNNLIGTADSWVSYSGSSTVRGSVNKAESSRVTIEGKVISKLVIDFPTNACNGNIKKIELLSKPFHQVIGDLTQYQIANKEFAEVAYESRTDFCLSCYDGQYGIIYYDKDQKHIVLNNRIYKLSGTTVDAISIHYCNNKLYLHTRKSNSDFYFREITLNELSKTFTVSNTDILISLKHTESNYSNTRFVFLSDYGGKSYVGAFIYGIASLYSINMDTLELTKITQTYVNSSESRVRHSASIDPTGKVYQYRDHSQIVEFDVVNSTIKYYSSLSSISPVPIAYNTHYCDNNLEFKIGEDIYLYQYRLTTSSGTDSSSTNYKILRLKQTTTIPLTITLNEPLEKTNEQSLKLVLDIIID